MLLFIQIVAFQENQVSILIRELNRYNNYKILLITKISQVLSVKISNAQMSIKLTKCVTYSFRILPTVKGKNTLDLSVF